MAKKVTILIPDSTYDEIQNLMQHYNSDTISCVISYSIKFLHWFKKHDKSYVNNKTKEKI